MEHHVYFWLKDDADRAAFEQGLEGLREIPTVADIYWGTPAATEKRPAVDQSWSYGIALIFDSIADHDAYQVHPKHVEFVETFRPMWSKVLIMDVE